MGTSLPCGGGGCSWVGAWGALGCGRAGVLGALRCGWAGGGFRGSAVTRCRCAHPPPLSPTLGFARAGGTPCAVDERGPVQQMAQGTVLAAARRHHGDLHRPLVGVLEPPDQPFPEVVVPGVRAGQLLHQRREFGDTLDGDQIRECEPVVLGQQLAHVTAPADDEADHPGGAPFVRPCAHGGSAESPAHDLGLGDGVELHPLTADPADTAPQGHAVVEALRVTGRGHLHPTPQPGLQPGRPRLRPRTVQPQHGHVLTAPGALGQPATGRDTRGHRSEFAVLGELQPHHGVRTAHHVCAGQRRVLVDEHAGAADGAVRAPAPQPEPPVRTQFPHVASHYARGIVRP